MNPAYRTFDHPKYGVVKVRETPDALIVTGEHYEPLFQGRVGVIVTLVWDGANRRFAVATWMGKGMRESTFHTEPRRWGENSKRAAVAIRNRWGNDVWEAAREWAKGKLAERA